MWPRRMGRIMRLVLFTRATLSGWSRHLSLSTSSSSTNSSSKHNNITAAIAIVIILVIWKHYIGMENYS